MSLRSPLQACSLSFVAAALCAFAVPAWSAGVDFTDNFTPMASPLWASVSGNWTASNGQYYATVPNNDPLSISLLPFVLTDYTLTVDVNQSGDEGILLSSDAAGNGLYVILGGAGYGQGDRGGAAGTSVYFQTLQANGQGSGLINLVSGVITPDTSFQVKVTSVGSVYSVYLGGSSVAVDSILYSGGSPAGGVVGLYDDQPNVTTGHGSGDPMSFSNFSLTSPVPELSTWSMLLAGVALGLAGRKRMRFAAGEAATLQN